jgi:hypothetical protein
MPGGRLHSPIWTPYALYGTVDYIYGWPAYNARNGFTAAQTILNVVETLGYLYYLWIVYRHGATVVTGRGGKKLKKGFVWLLTGEKVVAGRTGAIALLVAFTTSVMTLSKTILYCKSLFVSFWGEFLVLTFVGLNELFSGFDNIGHNSPASLILLWIIPK